MQHTRPYKYISNGNTYITNTIVYITFNENKLPICTILPKISLQSLLHYVWCMLLILDVRIHKKCSIHELELSVYLFSSTSTYKWNNHNVITFRKKIISIGTCLCSRIVLIFHNLQYRMTRVVRAIHNNTIFYNISTIYSIFLPIQYNILHIWYIHTY